MASSKYNDFIPVVISNIIYVTAESEKLQFTSEWQGTEIDLRIIQVTISFLSCIFSLIIFIGFTGQWMRFRYTRSSFGSELKNIFVD